MSDNNKPMTIDMTEYPTLALVNSPADLRQFPEERLTQLCQELRTFLLHSVSRSSGHLASGLRGVKNNRREKNKQPTLYKRVVF